MSDHHHQQPFPRLPLVGAALLIAFSMGVVGLVRLDGRPAPVTKAAPVAARDFVFEDRPDGSVAVLDGAWHGIESAKTSPARCRFGLPDGPTAS